MSASTVTPTATILAVDDDVDILDLLAHVFKRQSYRPLQASSGEEALRVLRSDPSVDVILLDIMMPGGMSGLDVLRHIRADPALRPIPVLLVTAVGLAEKLTAGLEAGADDYITKPFTARELLARVNVALHIARSRRALHEAEERYRLLVETARDLVFALDMQGRFTYVSPSALAITGYAPETFLSPESQLSLLDVVHPDDRQRVQEALLLALRGVSGDDLQCRLVRRDGGQRWLSLSWSPIPDASGAQVGVQAIARDVTARRRADDAIFQRSQELAALNLIASRVNQSLDLNTTLADALGALMEVLSIDCGVIYLVEADRVVARAWHGLSEAVLSRIRTPALSEVSWIDRIGVYHAVQAVAIPPFDQVAAELRATSWLVAPLREREKLHGAIVLGSRAQRRFGENEVTLIRTVADQIAVAIVNARLYEETRRRVDELALLNEVGRALTSTLNLDEVLNAIMEEAVGVVQGEAGSVLLLDEARGELYFAAAVGPAADQLRGVRLPHGAGIAAQALSSGRPLLIADAQSDERFYDRVDVLTGLTTRSLMALPLRAHGRVIGVMEALNKRGGLFTQDDLRLLDSLAQTAATAIDNAQLYARERIRVQQLTTLNEIAQHIVASLTAEALLHDVASLIHNRLSYPLVAVGLVDPGGLDMVIQGAAGAVRGELAVGARLPLHGALIGALIADGHSRIENAVDDTSSEAGSQADAPGSRAVVPIILEGIVTGIVVVESPQPRAFTAIDTTTLEAVAGLVATAIANSRLFEQVRRRNRELTAMHAISAAVSQSLELDDVLEAALVLTHQLFEADGSRIRLIEGDQLVLKTSLGTWHDESSTLMREPIAGSFEGLSVQRGAVELLPDVSRAGTARRVDGWPDRGPARPGAIAAVPLWGYDRVQGVMTLAWRAPREFGNSTQPLLAAIGQQIGVAVERGLLYEATRRRENELGAINDIIRSVTSTLDLEQVLTAAMHGVREAMQVEYGALLLVDEADGNLHFRKTLGPAGERLVDQVLRPNEGIAGWVVAQRQSLCVNDAASDARYARRFEEITHIAVSSVLAAPLIVKERVIGAIEVVNKPGGMTESDEKLLNALAASVAVAIDNARLYQELAESARALERSHAQLVQSEKLAATGRLALSLAHEINNPLQAVANCLHLALEPDLSEQRRHEFLIMARDEVERLSLLIQRMLELYRPSPGSSTSCDVNAALQRVLALAEQKFRHNRIQVDTDLDATLPAARIASDQATQVFLNLAVNAAEAMSAGGQLMIASRLDGTGDWVEVTFTDTGPGIPADVLPHIFEPFFTTKATGSGLGLAVSYSIVEGHGGRFTAASQPGQGATFSVRLRAVIDEATERALRHTALADPRQVRARAGFAKR